MATEYIGEYLVEYGGEALCLGKGWAAYIAIYDVTRNPAFRAALIPRQRVSLDTVFLTEEAATERAREVAVAKIGRSAGAKPG
ncbi:hypothetical protein [Noviherbaspirillum denitrificans]|uniref:Uncharacterized protein n=1 Tax=Noviherbaspirillum denitrificans TaxID=1968433 RepID=A0A254T684_9BURK|nr:hypothetical protein [Noviherbaspirillum denitrificans]OWW18181.1 hypothetical protein AYR66_01795 [Noviherbaspirillum denitrificans]